MYRTDVYAMVTGVDPLPATDADEWAASGAADRILRSVIATDLTPAASRRRIRGGRALVFAAGLVVLLAGAAAAGALLFGGPAPEGVKRDLRAVDAGMPADLRYNPDVQNAVSVASTGPSTL